jgi:FKBP-type peptidyl-prolyl cis-trans isomerase FkpA
MRFTFSLQRRKVYWVHVHMLRPRPHDVTAIALVLLCVASGACDEPPTSPNTAAYTQTDLRVGTGDEAAVGRTVTVHYTGWLYDSSQPTQRGMQFDTSSGRDPFEFIVGAGQVISGWDQGVPGMRVGGLRRLVLPPSLAYGDTRNGPIPPSATLLFEIELLAVE